MDAGDRYQLAERLQSALDHLERSVQPSLADADSDREAARLLIESARDQLLGIRPADEESSP